MQKVIFLYIGRLKTPWIAEGCKHFVSRLGRCMDLKMVEIPASRQLDDEKQKQEESAAILKRLESLEGDVWLLDERGSAMTSTEFAEAMGKSKDAGRTVVFVLGGAYGVTDALRKRANRMLQLSTMTFPHEFCCLVFLEQLYRSCEIRKGSGYHH